MSTARLSRPRPVTARRAFVPADEVSVPEALRPARSGGTVAPVSSAAGRVDSVFPRAGTGPAAEGSPGPDRIAVAEAFGIPWERLLDAEIQAERALRGFVGEPDRDLPLWRFVSALPATALDSWRFRERLAALVRQARLTRSGADLRSVRQAVDELCGRRNGADSQHILSLHLALAHERVRELARLARAAERCRGGRGERLSRIVARTGCTDADAAWALDRLETPGRTHAIDDAVRQAREEGFDIPAAESEFHAFLALRKLVRQHPVVRPRVARRRRARAGLKPHRLAS